MSKPKVGIVMGSNSDLPVMQNAAKILDKFGINYELRVISAHRTPDLAHEYAKTARDRGIKVIIAGAGKAAHLAGVIASLTTLPVIGVPIKTSTMGGLDSLLSTVQMPRGVPVATVSIDGAKNAGLLAAQILATSNPDIQQKLADYKSELKQKVTKTASKLEKEGYKDYLKNELKR